MEPWSAWSWLMGIKPIHPNGWVAVGMYWMAAIPLMLGAAGVFDLGAVVQAVSAVAFVAISLVMFALVAWRFNDRDA